MPPEAIPTTLWRSLDAVSPKGERFRMDIALGAPQPQGEDCACAVSITQLFEPARLIHGIDGWQVTQLAMGFVLSQLKHFQDSGGELRWAGTAELLDLKEMAVAPLF
ncbi:MAG: hypothetical protein U1E77_03320 [Inhella sp.]